MGFSKKTLTNIKPNARWGAVSMFGIALLLAAIFANGPSRAYAEEESCENSCSEVQSVVLSVCVESCSLLFEWGEEIAKRAEMDAGQVREHLRRLDDELSQENYASEGIRNEISEVIKELERINERLREIERQSGPDEEIDIIEAALDEELSKLLDEHMGENYWFLAFQSELQSLEDEDCKVREKISQLQGKKEFAGQVLEEYRKLIRRIREQNANLNRACIGLCDLIENSATGDRGDISRRDIGGQVTRR